VAEDLLGGILGSEDTQRPAPARPGTEAFAAAVATSIAPDKADAILKATGNFLDCYRFRGDILDHRGDWAAAQKACAGAVALAPELPAGYYSWGLALAKYHAALKYAPNWKHLKDARAATAKQQG